MNERGGKDRTFNCLDGAYGDVFSEIEIDCTNLCVCVGGDLLLDFAWTLELLLYRSMEPPLIALSDERGAASLETSWQIAASRANLDPTPAGPRPDFDEDAACGPFLPHACIERSRLIPCAWGNWWTITKLLAFGLGLLLLALPLPSMSKERTCRAKSGMNGSATEHRRKVFSDLGKRHQGMRVLLRGMCKLFQSGQGLFIGQV